MRAAIGADQWGRGRACDKLQSRRWQPSRSGTRSGTRRGQMWRRADRLARPRRWHSRGSRASSRSRAARGDDARRGWYGCSLRPDHPNEMRTAGERRARCGRRERTEHGERLREAAPHVGQFVAAGADEEAARLQAMQPMSERAGADILRPHQCASVADGWRRQREARPPR